MNGKSKSKRMPDTVRGDPDLEELLALTRSLKAFHSLAESVARNHGGVTDAEDPWEALVAQARTVAKELERAPACAESAFARVDSPDKRTSRAHLAKILRAWPDHPKRKGLLALLSRFDVDARIADTVDQVLHEGNGQLLELLDLNLSADLCAMLEAQARQFSELAAEVEQAQRDAHRREVLRTFLHANAEPSGTYDDLAFDVFADGTVAVRDFEPTVAAITTYAVLKGASL